MKSFFSLFAYGPIKFLNRSICPIDGTLTDTTTMHQSGTGSNGNVGVFSTPQFYRNGTSLSDAD